VSVGTEIAASTFWLAMGVIAIAEAIAVAARNIFCTFEFLSEHALVALPIESNSMGGLSFQYADKLSE
jgi:hypothetical protein